MLNSFDLPLQFYSPSCILFCGLKGFWLSCSIDNTLRKLVESKRVRSVYIIPLLSPSRVTMGWLYFFQSVLTTYCWKLLWQGSRYYTIPQVYLSCALFKHSFNHPTVHTIFFSASTLMHTETIALTESSKFCVSLANIFSLYGDQIVAAWKVIDYTDYIKWVDSQECSLGQSFLQNNVSKTAQWNAFANGFILHFLLVSVLIFITKVLQCIGGKSHRKMHE